jgi:hypothetical protein
MKAAEDRSHGDLAEPLNRTTKGCIFGEGEMRSGFVIVAGVGQKDPAQMGFAEDDDVIEASRRIEPMSLSACPFCQGDRGAVG